jgi:hypothetical protein
MLLERSLMGDGTISKKGNRSDQDHSADEKLQSVMAPRKATDPIVLRGD